MHLGRLAVDESAKNQRLGKALLADALKRSAGVADQLGIYAVEVYALTENARVLFEIRNCRAVGRQTASLFEH